MGVHNLDNSQQKALLVAAQCCAAFSLFGSVFILVCFACFKHLRKLSFTLVAWLAIADIGADITYFMGNPVDNQAACIVQGSLQQFFQMAQILWTIAIACILYDVTINLHMYHPHDQARLMRRFHGYVWGASLVGMLLPFTTNSYGSTGSWCWIKTTEQSEFDLGTMWRYLVLYVPLWLAIAFNIIVYVKIIGVIRRFSAGVHGDLDSEETIGPSHEQQMRMRKFVRRLMWYPAVLILSWMFATVNRVQNAVRPDKPVFALFLLHACLVRLQGFFNAVVYGTTDTVRVAVLETSLVQCLLTGCRRPRLPPEADPEDEVANPPAIISSGVSTGTKRFSTEGLVGGNDPEEHIAETGSVVMDSNLHI